jgi:hypothetical protein
MLLIQHLFYVASMNSLTMKTERKFRKQLRIIELMRRTSQSILVAGMLVLAPFAVSDGHKETEIKIPSEAFSLTGKLMNIELTDTGGTITVAGTTGIYGRVRSVR